MSTIPSHDEQESLSFDISYDDVPLQFKEAEVNEENETSKEPSVPVSPVKTHKPTQTKYNMPFVQKLKTLFLGMKSKF